MVPRDVFHREVRGVRCTAVRDRFDLDQVRLANLQESDVVLDLLHVPLLDEGEPVHRALPFAPERLEACQEALPKVFEEGSVHGPEALLGRGVDRHVELRHRNQVFDFFRELSVGDEEAGDVALVQLGKHLVDPRVHDRLAHQGEGAVPDGEGLLDSLELDPLSALELVHHAHVQAHRFLHDLGRRVFPPAPLAAYGVLVVPPAEDALVGAGEGRGGLHALVAGDAVEGVLVAQPT
mmetsp:Transcript_47801/g.108476  ORF Transcript_47801/g.108476 Transcript_47801/m.108476 type:complete len:236 (-) Transcript_47801:64-771(-)